MKRFLVLTYAIASYAVFFATFLYAIGFVGNFGVSSSIDANPSRPFVEALLIDLGLLALFALQHSGMARRGFKQWWTKIVPEAAERATYVLFSSVALILLFWLWQPIGGLIWDFQGQAAQVAIITLYMFGWALVLVSTFLIDHFDLFGLKQAWGYFRGRPYQPPRFHTPSLYRIVRHPLYVGWLIVMWAAPTMTVAHLVFALMSTAYILIAIQLEEKDLVHFHGDQYTEYKKQVPMLIPGRRRYAAAAETA
ncbi:MAG: isoprenylcysteine carboxylmethyltransferase family protein [Xanthomonadales bacterium]|nr:isoprenylcysteine carboxylmethyltransferase family protein [Xanthomonadales bacterium]